MSVFGKVIGNNKSVCVLCIVCITVAVESHLYHNISISNGAFGSKRKHTHIL